MVTSLHPRCCAAARRASAALIALSGAALMLACAAPAALAQQGGATAPAQPNQRQVRPAATPAPAPAPPPREQTTTQKLLNFLKSDSNNNSNNAQPVPQQPVAQTQRTPRVTRGQRAPVSTECTQDESPLQTRTPESVRELFRRGEASGSELMRELLAIRRAADTGRSQGLGRQLNGCQAPGSNTAAANGNTANSGGSAADKAKAELLSGLGSLVGDLFKKNAGKVAGSALGVDPKVIEDAGQNVSASSLRAHLSTLTDDASLTTKERVKLPSAQNLSTPEQQRILTMAALVVGGRVSGRILDRAKADFDNLEADYTALLQRREKSAAVFFEVLQKRRRAQETQQDLEARKVDGEIAQTLPREDLDALARLPASMTLAEFSNDFTAQNIGLRWLRRSDPAAYADYRASADGLVGRTRAYVRSVSGVAAYGGLVALFGREVMSSAKSRNVSEMAASLPFAAEFLKDALPLMLKAGDVALHGIVIQPIKAATAKRYRLVQDSETQEAGDAAAVYKQLGELKADELLTGALFRDEAPGLLHAVYQCDPQQAAEMLDATLLNQDRTDFAQAYYGAADVSAYSFVDAVNSKDAAEAQKTRETLAGLLARNHRVTTNDNTGAFGELQQKVAEHYTRWSDEHLMRLIFANREGSAAGAGLQLGAVVVKPIPSMQSVYAYEASVNGCTTAVAAAAR